jgi:chaperone BCS1
MMFWLSSLPQFRQFRDFSVSTSNFSLEDDALELDDGVDADTRRRTRPVRYLPSHASSYRMWYKGRFITISRTKEENRWTDKSTLGITSVSSVYHIYIVALKYLFKEYFLVTVLSWIL